MTVKVNNCEGTGSGNNVTTGDTSSGDAWNTAQPGTGGSLTWDNTHAAHGSRAIKISTGGTSTSTYVAWTGLSISRVRGRANVYITASPPTVTQVIARGMASSLQKFRLYVNTSGKLVIADSSNVSQTTLSTTIPANQWFRVEWDITAGTSAAYEVRLYTSVDSSSATETASGSASNFGSGNFDEVRYGTAANFANVVGYWLDDLGLSDTGFMGPALHTVSMGQPVETDTAQPFTVSKARSFGQATETDTANAFRPVKSRILGQPTETDTANPFSRLKTRTLGQATEADTALPVTALKGRGIGQASETDTAQPFRAAKTVHLGQVVEADTALPFTAVRTVGLGTVVETDTAQPMTPVKRIVLGQVVELDTAYPMVAVKAFQAGLAAVLRTPDPTTVTRRPGASVRRTA